jgi:hypothetical protein
MALRCGLDAALRARSKITSSKCTLNRVKSKARPLVQG